MDDNLMVILVNAAIWSFRLWYDGLGAKSDLILILAFSVGAFRIELASLLLRLIFPAALVVASSAAFVLLQNVLDLGTSWSGEDDIDRNATSKWQALEPLIFPCRTTHTRMFPKKHSFSYSYLFVGIPIGWQGSVGSFLSADLDSISRNTREDHPTTKSKPWLSVEAQDHLSRSSHVRGLKGKLDAYLRAESENPEDYAFAYLITAPRFCGYSFNPVSFWYLYNKQRELKAMILEVNNTFDERRMYFLRDTGVGIPDPLTDINDRVIDKQNTANKPKVSDFHIAGQKTPLQFTNSWPKDFHVSPFNSRKGSYSLVADDPVSPYANGNKPIDNTITLSSSKSQAKIIARVFSISHTINPSTITSWGKLSFLASWWWVGFVTFPRIIKEAGLLFFKRKLGVWHRPEVLKDSIGRHETHDERAIAHAFRSLLGSLISQSELSAPIRFESGISAHPNPELIFPNRLRQSEAANPIDFKIITPLFYARLARHSHISEFLTSEILDKDDKSRTLYISRNPEIILSLFDDNASPSDLLDPSDSSLVSRLRSSFLLALRNLIRTPNDIRHLPMSLLDKFTIQHPHETNFTAYRRAVLKILASDILALGMPEILDAVFWISRVVLYWTHVIAVKEALSWSGWLQSTKSKRTESWSWHTVLGWAGAHGWWMIGKCL